jgi:molybdate-binding protein
MMAATVTMTPAQRAIYKQLLSAAKAIGPFKADPKKTSIHLTRRSAFAGVAIRKDALLLTIKSATDIRSPRIVKREQTSANRWHLEIRLEDPKEVDRELTSWLAEAMRLAG